ncbi:uncharacterized protein LOC129575272 isoform X6 [Sitodiplosis mosellana]|uniref:uncharacterized protein LOC129575272 isoform X6 n=1 Tax=Sitodiplosis mosellana TaxID=263140 RepID=UPI002443B137|nr:uncharacterized protein LOC129575272 isoform X6 [Sitodiplosis mosellana]XP_055314643.1 uncharacterized protein LOC129575272 isoform X6 [Sitodiplosis mosellana]XP_055314654.1 uncharacterized protein LOC129575272 isoform X6 [Sitodiplosis mosellana]XP_055314665.1 uncharacterized protein LOC129575272 isoform X6 [Sitodiplosis mosellana]XP_055314674.1 uncharacterized protein LOC129575272 isoform X6 [Sitodiplosis mosellana]XP_055314686.1 uncharacterized protein LOC129575272 isoform X6 [Sitodiplosi
MDADRRNFINNKSVGVAVPTSQQPTAIENGSNNSSHSAANGTISTSSTESSSDSSVEPPKQPFNDSNSNKDFHEQNNVCVEEFKSSEQRNCDDGIAEKRTGSVQSNDRDSKDVLCSVLSVAGNERILPEKMGLDDLRDVYINSTSSSSSPLVLFSAQANSNHDKNDRLIGKHQNGDDNNYNSIDHQNEPCNPSNGLINKKDSHHCDYTDNCEQSNNDGVTAMTAIDRYDNANTNGINSCTIDDTDVSINSNCVETATKTLSNNQLSKICRENTSEEPNQVDTLEETAAKLLVQNSSEDCISTDTISSNSIDVKPIKCPTDRSQTASESEEIGGKDNEEIITSKSDDNITEENRSEKQSANMFDDNSLKTPLLSKKSNGNSNNNNATTVYSAIERPILTNNSKDRGGLFTKNTKRSASDESRPLLRQMSSDDGSASQKIQRRSNARPRSIVKSPSTQNFSSGTEKFDINRKPRLSIQCTGNDPERPVLHVQFLSQQHNDSNDSIKRNLINNVNSPSSGEHELYQNGSGSQCDSAEKPPEELINQMPPRGILRTSRLRSSISSSSSESTSSSSDSSSSDDISQFAEAKPPDGGWGWVIVFASFMVNLIADGITFSFGVIYVELLKYFGEGKAKTAWIGSLFMAMPLLSGPIASFLTDRFGCRKVTIIGSVLASIGFFVSSFTDSVEMLCFTFGIFAGFGLSLCYVAAVVIVAYYFDKRRSFATGLSVCGSGIGTFLFAPLTQMLIREYGWRGTTLILSGLFLNMTVCGMLMRDLEWTTYKSKQKAKLRRKRNKLGISADSFSASNSTNTGGTTSNLHKDDANGNDIDRSDENDGDNNLANQTENIDDPRLFSSLITLPTFVKNGEKVPVEVLELMSANKNVHNVLLKNYPGLAHSRSFSQPLTSSRHSNGSNVPLENSLSPTSPTEGGGGGGGVSKKDSQKSRRIRNEQEFLSWMKRDPHIHHAKDVRIIMHRNPTAYLKDLRMHRHSLTYRGAMLNINRYRLRASSCPDIYRNSMTTIAKEKTQWTQGLKEFKSVLVDMLDFSFFTDIRFTLFAISNFLLYAWYDVPYVYLADNAVELGFREDQASIFIAMIGIVNMVGEIILGWFGDRKFMTAGMIYAICMVFCGLVTGLVPLLPSFTGLSILSGLFGLFIAANYALTSIILVELISLERFTNAYGLLLLVQGIANLIGPPLAGWISDLTGDYKLAFYLAGFFIALSGLIMMLLPARGKIRKYRAFRRRCRSSGDEDDVDDDDEDDDVSAMDIEKCIQIIETPRSSHSFNGNANGVLNNGGSKVNQV